MKIEEIKRKVPVEDVLEFYGAELGSGSGWNSWVNIRCPWHDDRAMSASYTTGTFICHAGCVQGDVLDLVQYGEGLDDVRDAMRFLEEHFLEEDER